MNEQIASVFGTKSLCFIFLTFFSVYALSQSITVKDANYRIVLRMDGNVIKNNNYKVIGRIDGSVLNDGNNKIIARIDGSPRRTQLIAMLYFLVL